MTDLQLPKPLLSPSQWPSSRPALLSIDTLRYGGPFAPLVRAGGVRFSVPDHFWLREAEPSFAALINELEVAELTLVSKTALDRGELEAWKTNIRKPIHFLVDRSLVRPTLLEWSIELFPEGVREAGDLHWTRLIRDYEKQLGSSVAGIDALRFWPSFLRSQKLFFADTVAREWAYAQALFSPQDDSRGTGAFVLQNPTLQVVVDKQTLVGLWRIDGGLHRRDLTWEEAAVIDELRETSRLPLERLRTELHAKRFPLKNHSTFNLVIESMIKEGLLVLRP